MYERSHSPLPCAYRSSERHDEHLRVAAERPLRAAGEALNLAVLCLEDADEEEGPAARQRRAAQARGFLVEASLALGRARVFLPAIRGYSVPVILAIEAEPEAELGRLHQIATRLLWYNHALLPTRGQVSPLRPEDEAQLAVLVRGLARTARLDRVLRHAWIGAAVAVAVLGPTLGITAVALLMTAVVMLVAAVQLGRWVRPGTAAG
jgi:hypothetical protein